MGAIAIPAVLGAAGLYQANRQASDARHTADKGLREQQRLDDAKLGNMDAMRKLADGYDPQAETAASLKAAQDTGAATLEQSLRNLSAQYRTEGGIPGLSSEYVSRTIGTANRALDPLKVWAAQQATGATQRKAQLYAMANGAAPGQVGDDYFRMASMMPQSNPSGSFASLLQAFQGLTGPKKTGGAGGTGDQTPGLGGGSYNNPLEGGSGLGGGSYNNPLGYDWRRAMSENGGLTG